MWKDEWRFNILASCVFSVQRLRQRQTDKNKNKNLCAVERMLCYAKQNSGCMTYLSRGTLFDSRVVWWRKSLCVMSFALHKISFAAAKRSSLFFSKSTL